MVADFKRVSRKRKGRTGRKNIILDPLWQHYWDFSEMHVDGRDFERAYMKVRAARKYHPDANDNNQSLRFRDRKGETFGEITGMRHMSES